MKLSSSLLAIEIGGTKLPLLLSDTEGRTLQSARLQVDPEKGGEGIRRQISETLAAWKSNGSLAGVGVGFGGPIDWRSGAIACSHQIEGWSGFGLRSWLEDLTGAPVMVDNDANVAALGEALHGAGKGLDHVFYVTLGSGVGGGMVNHGQIYHGATPGEAEIGHIRLDRSGAIVESRCSGWAVDARIRQIIQSHPDGLLARLAGGERRGEARFLAEAIRQNDPSARRLLSDVADDLAWALSHVTHLFHPQMIIIGGGLSLLGEPLRAAVAAALPQYLMKAFQGGPQVQLAALGENAVPAGALQLAHRAAGLES